MYKIYLDKNELFEADIDLYGAKFTETSARLIMNTDRWNLVFEGDVNMDGKIVIPITKLKDLFSEGFVGNLKLEVIAGDTYFTPWEDEFELLRSKNVTVEVKDKDEKKNVLKESVKNVKVKNVTKPEQPKSKVTKSLTKSYLREVMIANKLLREGVELKSKVKTITDKFVSENNLDNNDKKKLYSVVHEWINLNKNN